jgi:hypothetical protein
MLNRILLFMVLALNNVGLSITAASHVDGGPPMLVNTLAAVVQPLSPGLRGALDQGGYAVRTLSANQRAIELGLIAFVAMLHVSLVYAHHKQGRPMVTTERLIVVAYSGVFVVNVTVLAYILLVGLAAV